MTVPDDRLIRQRAFFFGMVAVLALLVLLMIMRFTKPILFALAVVVILKPLYNWLLQTRLVKGSEKRATGLTMLIFVLVIAIPLILIFRAAIFQAANLLNGFDIEGLDFTLRSFLAQIATSINSASAGNLQLDELQLVEGITRTLAGLRVWMGELLLNLGRALPGFFTNAVIVLVIILVLLPRYRRPGKQDILEIVPFPTEITQLFLDKIDLMIKAMFKGTFVIALAQGTAMGVILLIAGVPYTMFLTILSIFLSFLPLIGVSLIAWPVGIILIVIGEVWRGVFVIAAFIVLVANIDTVLRPMLIPKGAQLNPALVILSVFGGLGMLGIIGALYGPVLMILLVTSIDVYTKYMLRADLEVLARQGRIDLKALGLVSEDDQQNQNVGEMAWTALKNVSARFRRETPVAAAVPAPPAEPGAGDLTQ